MADVLACGGEEGRGIRRNATGSGKRATIRGYPNGETRRGDDPRHPLAEHISQGVQPGELKHLSTRRRRKQKRFRE